MDERRCIHVKKGDIVMVTKGAPVLPKMRIGQTNDTNLMFVDGPRQAKLFDICSTKLTDDDAVKDILFGDFLLDDLKIRLEPRKVSIVSP